MEEVSTGKGSRGVAEVSAFKLLTEELPVLKRTIVAGVAIAALLVLSPYAAFAGAEKAANTVAMCGCGMMFTPSAETKYIDFEGKSYACCTEGCHKMASGNPAGVAKMANEQMAKMRMQSHMKVGIANVTAVTEKGTMAHCGCGKSFAMETATPFLKVGEKTYACCSKACHEMSSKDPAGSAKMFEAKMAEDMAH
jgi:hypothetical protein